MVKLVLASIVLLVLLDFAVTRGEYSRVALHATERGIRYVAHMGDGTLFSW